MIAPARVDSVTAEEARRGSSEREIGLMLRVQDDDSEAFGELMHRYQGRLKRLFRRRTGSWSGAEDFVQDVFLRVWQARRGYIPRSCFSTWLYTIANHAASNTLRSWSRQSNLTARFRRHCAATGRDTQFDAVLGHKHVTPPGIMLEGELNDCVQRAMESLRPRQRYAMQLKLDDLSYQEMATRLHVSTDAVKSLLARSRADLRRRLKPYLASGRRPYANSRCTSLPRDRERTRRDASAPVSC